MALGIVFGLEILTPNDALLALGLPPLLAAMWVLSGRFTAVVSGLTLVLFAVVLFAEAANRLTIISIEAAALILAAAARLYATSLSDVLQHRGNRQVARNASPTLAARIQFHGIESLTRREVEVARLASRGYTDSEIADDLGISERTVESHLAHVYGKLGVTSRRVLIRRSDELAAQPRHGGSLVAVSETVQRVVHRH